MSLYKKGSAGVLPYAPVLIATPFSSNKSIRPNLKDTCIPIFIIELSSAGAKMAEIRFSSPSSASVHKRRGYVSSISVIFPSPHVSAFIVTCSARTPTRTKESVYKQLFTGTFVPHTRTYFPFESCSTLLPVTFNEHSPILSAQNSDTGL